MQVVHLTTHGTSSNNGMDHQLDEEPTIHIGRDEATCGTEPLEAMVAFIIHALLSSVT